MNDKKLTIVNSNISIGEYDKILNNIFELIITKSSTYVCVANVHMIIEAYKDKNFSNIVNYAEITTSDGMPIAKSINFIYGISQDRVAGMDMIHDLLIKCEEHHQSIFIYGGEQTTLNKFLKETTKNFPKLRIKVYSPPFRNLTEEEKHEDIQIINNYNPSVVFVALGCPKQEKWMAEHKNKINSCMIGLGGAIEVYAKVKNRAPKWMQKYSLEWLYRLIQDPKRLWKRYLYTNTLFIILFIKQYISIKMLKKEIE